MEHICFEAQPCGEIGILKEATKKTKSKRIRLPGGERLSKHSSTSKNVPDLPPHIHASCSEALAFFTRANSAHAKI